MCQSQLEDRASKAAFLKGQQHPIGFEYKNSPPPAPPPRLLSDLDRVLGALRTNSLRSTW